MNRKTPYWLFALSAALVFSPYPAYVYLVIPYAEGTTDPDAIEAIAWFGGILLMFVGFVLFPVALGTWLYERRESEKTTA